MAEDLYTDALTSVARVKDKMALSGSGLDTLITRLINGATDWIESQCYRKSFLSQTYANEIHSGLTSAQEYLYLKNLDVSSITSLEYRAGTPSSPSWTALIADEYELVEDGKAGMVRVYATVPYGTNSVRITYVAGFLIDWANAGTGSHTLPADLSDLCERMVVKMLRRRESYGKDAESFNDGGSVTWEKVMTDEDAATLQRYKRQQTFF